MERLLIVDDVELNRALLGEMFRTEFMLSEAENGRKAVEILEEKHDEISAVLLDLVMPELDGFGVLEEMIRRGWVGKIPVVMITAETSDTVMQKGYEMGAADIISKPFNPNIVRQRIHNVVEQYSYRHKLEVLVEEQTRELTRQSRELRENSVQLIDILSAIIEFKNTESVQHIYNLRVITKMLLTELANSHKEYGLTEEVIEASSEAAAMHDVGKIAIPDYILNKPGKLTAEEYEIMKTHTIRGCEILEKIATVRNLVYYHYCYEICRHHHERWDGKGYPDGLLGNEIPIWAQAVSLADVYDALISKRVYKDKVESKKAVQMILNGECGVFNPVLISCFLKVLPEIEGYIGQGIQAQRAVKVNATSIEVATAIHRGDISSRTLHLLEMERQKYQILSDLSEEIVFDYDLQKDQMTFSEKYQILTGRDLVVKNFKANLNRYDALSEKEGNRILEIVSHITQDDPVCRFQVHADLDGNGLQWYDVYLYSVWDLEFEPECVSYIGKLINIENQKQEEMRLQLAADSDPLTQLWNRNALKAKIEPLLNHEMMETGALCFIDIDNFKIANDSFGHAFGDSVLKRVAGLLKAGVRTTDLVGRIGGDEFLLFLRDIEGPEAGARVQHILKKMRNEFQDYQVSASVGVALYPHDGQDYETLFRRADESLYAAKQLGKDNFQFYG